jgi:hypothetical protein
MSFPFEPPKPERELPEIVARGADWQLARTTKDVSCVFTQRRDVFLHLTFSMIVTRDYG